MADRYSNYQDLKASEPEGAFGIDVQDIGSRLAIAAPHGGAIEPGTSEIAKAIAGKDLSYYLFEGKKANANGDLHITSTNFDEPQAIKLLSAAESVLTIHGESSDSETVFMGGLDKELVFALKEAFASCDFEVKEHDNSVLQGTNPKNICNIGRSGSGVQLELSRGLRLQFFESLNKQGLKQTKSRLHDFCQCVRLAYG